MGMKPAKSEILWPRKSVSCERVKRVHSHSTDFLGIKDFWKPKIQKFPNFCVRGNSWNFPRKAVFFTIDALLASGIIIVAVLLVSNFYSEEQQTVNINYASQDLARVFSTLAVGDANNEYVKSLVSNGAITNLDNTFMEQIGDFWYQGKSELAENFTKNLTENIIPSSYGFSILVNGEIVHSRNLPVKRALVSSRKMVAGITKDDKGPAMRGPDIIEIRVWE